MKKTIYIAGKVTGLEPIECAAKFEAMEQEILAKGYNVINPIKLVDNIHENWDSAMAICLKALAAVQGIFMMPCSVDSKGAQIELDFAIKFNLDIYDDIRDL